MSLDIPIPFDADETLARKALEDFRKSTKVSRYMLRQMILDYAPVVLDTIESLHIDPTPEVARAYLKALSGNRGISVADCSYAITNEFDMITELADVRIGRLLKVIIEVSSHYNSYVCYSDINVQDAVHFGITLDIIEDLSDILLAENNKIMTRIDSAELRIRNNAQMFAQKLSTMKESEARDEYYARSSEISRMWESVAMGTLRERLARCSKQAGPARNGVIRILRLIVEGQQITQSGNDCSTKNLLAVLRSGMGHYQMLPDQNQITNCDILLAYNHGTMYNSNTVRSILTKDGNSGNLKFLEGIVASELYVTVMALGRMVNDKDGCCKAPPLESCDSY